jgi:anti-sigma factor RsiW
MNCRCFQESLFEYMDDALSPAEKAAAETHLAQCDACLQVLRAQQQAAQALSARLRQHTQEMVLGADVQRRILTAMGGSRADAKERVSLAGIWLRLAWIGTAAACLVAGVWLSRGLHQGRPSGIATPVAVTVDISDSVPVYVFRQEENSVVDCLTCEPRVVAQTLWLPENH